jgi:hypothetical protein
VQVADFLDDVGTHTATAYALASYIAQADWQQVSACPDLHLFQERLAQRPPAQLQFILQRAGIKPLQHNLPDILQNALFDSVVQRTSQGNEVVVQHGNSAASDSLALRALPALLAALPGPSHLLHINLPAQALDNVNGWQLARAICNVQHLASLTILDHKGSYGICWNSQTWNELQVSMSGLHHLTRLAFSCPAQPVSSNSMMRAVSSPPGLQVLHIPNSCRPGIACTALGRASSLQHLTELQIALSVGNGADLWDLGDWLASLRCVQRLTLCLADGLHEALSMQDSTAQKLAGAISGMDKLRYIALGALYNANALMYQLTALVKAGCWPCLQELQTKAWWVTCTGSRVRAGKSFLKALMPQLQAIHTTTDEGAIALCATPLCLPLPPTVRMSNLGGVSKVMAGFGSEISGRDVCCIQQFSMSAIDPNHQDAELSASIMDAFSRKLALFTSLNTLELGVAMSAPLWGTLCTALALVTTLSSLSLSSWDSGSMQQLCTALAKVPNLGKLRLSGAPRAAAQQSISTANAADCSMRILAHELAGMRALRSLTLRHACAHPQALLLLLPALSAHAQLSTLDLRCGEDSVCGVCADDVGAAHALAGVLAAYNAAHGGSKSVMF